jgi:hypothetical protein
MEYNHRVIIRFLCKERVSPEDMYPHLEARFGDATYSERSVRRWFQYVRQGPEDVPGEVRSGRPLIDLLDLRILALLGEQPFHSAYSITEALGAFDSTILNHLQEWLGITIFHFRWITHELTTSLRQIRMETRREVSPILKAYEKNKFQRYVTGTES